MDVKLLKPLIESEPTFSSSYSNAKTFDKL